MEPLRTYDYLVLARKRVFEWARPLSADQYGRGFAMGLGSVGKTLTHIMSSEWYYVRRMMKLEVPPQSHWPIRDEQPPEFTALEAAWLEQVGRTRAAIEGMRDWKAEIEYRVEADEGPRIITASAADIFTQLVLHEVHHRAQVLNMLRQLGVKVEDVDFNALMYRRRGV